ncbi:hypothetical protein Nepgr_032236 [Nepenthes gracilis]|uniref:Uncharacterized protein n=1 Tax=Nepenthes gracilis TaxID=150966 RepID=A0AAD3TI84_NEPGR|nr:hypothetical protein Nepgr_032236 [Nepenthes gracilis]
MDFLKNETSYRIASGVNRLAFSALTVNCDKRPVLEEVAPDVLEVSDLIPGNTDDPIALTKDHAQRESKLEVHIAKQ